MELKKQGKLVVGYAVAGIAFAFLSTLTTGLIAGSIGLEFAGSVQGIVASFFSGDPLAILVVAITTIIVGVYVWIFGYIGLYLKEKITGMGTMKLPARPHIIGFLLMGIVAVGVLAIFDEILTGVDAEAQLTDLGSFMTAITSGNIVIVILSFLAFAGLGFLVIWLSTKFATLEKFVPDKAKKI